MDRAKRKQNNQERKRRKGANNPEKLTAHHRKPRSKGGELTRRNISMVPRKQHEAFTTLFENKNPEEIADCLNEKWIDPDYLVVVVKKKWLTSEKIQKHPPHY